MKIVVLIFGGMFVVSTALAQNRVVEFGSMLEGLIHAAVFGTQSAKSSVVPQLKCETYKIGEFRAFQNPIGTYGIRKVANDRYEAHFNLKFTAAKGTDPQKAIEMRARVKKCYSDVSPLTAGPNANLTLHLVDENSELAKSIPVVGIEVTDGNIRGHTRNYAVNFSCLTIVHETLHYMGLLDEYDGKFDGYNCRAVNDSIMASHYNFGSTPFGIRRIDYAEPRNELEVLQWDYFAESPDASFISVDEVNCLSPDVNTEDRDIWRSLTRKSESLFKHSHYSTVFIPNWKQYINGDHFYIRESDIKTSRKEKIVKLNSHLASQLKLASGKEWTCKVQKVNPSGAVLGRDLTARIAAKFSSPESLPLRYGHFRKFLFPNCEAKNKVYDLCTREAYKATATANNCLRDQVPLCLDRAWLE